MRSMLAVAGLLAALVMLNGCKGMYDSLEEYAGEQVYPSKYDTIVGKVGYERVEIDLLKAGRIPSSQIQMGKARKTVIEYDDQVITIDSLVSWVNITGLSAPKLYRFRVYTIDEFDNKSVAQEIALIPYTSSDLEALVIASPRILLSPSSAVISWPNGLSSVLLDYYGLNYRYTDKDGAVRDGERGQDSRFFIGNILPGQQTTVQVDYQVVPKVNNVPIIDTVTLSSPLTLDMPTASTPFTPAERDILAANGVTTFTADGVASIEKLTFPVHANSLQDLFYFSNLKEIDLTGGTLFTLPKLVYDRNGAHSEIGDGPWLPFMRKAGDIAAADAQPLKDLLESGILQKIKYVPHSMGLDALLEPYVASGVAELVQLPAEAPISPANFLVNGQVQDNAWRMDLTYPAADAPGGSGLENILKAVLKDRSASFALSVPKEYQFNLQEYRYLKFKVYAPAKSAFSGIYAPYQRIWPRFMNYMWAFANESNYGQEYWAPNADDYRIPDASLQSWYDITVDLSSAATKHNRVIVINMGGEPSLTFAPPADMVYYFANFRLTK